MKYKKILPIVASSLLIFASCDDNLMEWGKDPDHGEVTGAELPLELVEKISRYQPLKSYTDFILGNGIGADLYMSDEAYRKIVNENFDEVTPGYAMKHGAMVKADGGINFTTIDAFIAKTKEAGLSVFGHTLVWHSNNNASYLNGIIAPTVIPGSSGPNSLSLTNLENGSFTGWTKWNAGLGITVENNLGIAPNTKAVKLIAKTDSSQPYSLQLTTPTIPIVNGHRYEISFYIKSDITGKGRVSFGDGIKAENQYNNRNYYGTGSASSFETKSAWQQVKFTVPASEFDAVATAFKFNIDLGFLPNVTYLLDVNTLSVVDLDAVPTVVNIITNGDFEVGSLTGWNGWGNSSTRSISASGEGYGGGYAMKLTNPTAKDNYSAQQVYTLSQPLIVGQNYTFTCMIKAEGAGTTIQVQTQNTAGDAADYYGGNSVGTSWTPISLTITPTKANLTKVIFDFGQYATTYLIDNVVLSSEQTTGGPTNPITIVKTDAEKTTIIGNAMTDWVSKMMTHYKTSVFAWDVVNEPMKEDGTLRNGTEGETADDHFSWAKYLGKDYAVKAFKLARQYGNATDKLFINDYNLESRLDKCDGLIEYVKYIESQGATVDGIGTQMHIGLTTDKGKIDQMFQKLAASGKLIKISELDVRLGTKTPTVAQQASQSEMYQYVIDSYKKYIPAAQQYGVTIWGVSDSEKEHEYWLPDESPNLWDANYVRKHAYKGTADGLAGKDVSKDFSGELQP